MTCNINPYLIVIVIILCVLIMLNNNKTERFCHMNNNDILRPNIIPKPDTPNNEIEGVMDDSIDNTY